MSFQMTFLEEILNYFKPRNCWLNSILCAKCKLSHSDVNTCVFFVKNETLKFVMKKVRRSLTKIYLFVYELSATSL